MLGEPDEKINLNPFWHTTALEQSDSVSDLTGRFLVRPPRRPDRVVQRWRDASVDIPKKMDPKFSTSSSYS
ncbi:hypothetical protein E4U54_000637 [Claviceps lovelessii]|nr:hypothetical protein E4U54_000637 [Claviceps lovelessii]